MSEQSKQPEILTIEVRGDDEAQVQGNSLVQIAQTIVIHDDLSALRAKEFLDRLDIFLKGPGTYHDKEIDMAHKMHKYLCTKRNALVDPIEKIKKIVKDNLAKYLSEQERKREEERRKAEAEAKRIEQEKQAKIQAKIDEENRKIQAAKDEEARIQREKDAELKKVKDRQERDRLEKEEAERRAKQAIIDAENEAKSKAKAEELEEKKENVYVAPKVVEAATVIKGFSTQFTYEPEVTDQAIVPDMYKTVDLGLLRDMQRKMNGKLIVPGVNFKKVAVGANRKAAA